MIGAALGAIGGAAKGFAPAFGQLMQNERQDEQFAARQEADNTDRIARRVDANADRMATQEYRSEQLGMQRENNEATQERLAVAAAADATYRQANLDLQQARLSIDQAREERLANNAGMDYRSGTAERAAAAITAHMRDRPSLEPDIPPEEYMRAIAQWEQDREQIARVWGFSNEEGIQRALGGEPATHNPQESGVSKLRRDERGRLMRPDGTEDPAQRLMRLQEESGGASFGDYYRNNMGR